MPRICVFPRVDSFGGVTSFRLKFENGLRSRDVDVTYDLSQSSDVILVLAGTKHLIPLWKAHSSGRRIVQRLDGVNWVHRVRWAGLKYTVRATYGNANLAFIRNHIADQVIYQSNFIKSWWEDWYRPARVPSDVILNGADLSLYTPDGKDDRPKDHFRLLVVEGSLSGALDSGLFYAIELADQLSTKHKIELVIVGRVDESTKKRLEHQEHFQIRFSLPVPRDEIPQLMRSSHLLFSAEVNPPCPNSVIEALSCGLPVIGFDTGSLSEIVQGDAGRLTPYGANQWKLEQPNIAGLVNAAEEILQNNDYFRKAARAQAEAKLSLDQMLDSYIKVLLG